MTPDWEPYFLWLDEIHGRSKACIWGAAPRLAEEFAELDEAKAGQIITKWMTEIRRNPERYDETG